MNGKGGMNNEEFERYVDNSIIPFFPDLEDIPGNCIMLKVESGHGCNLQDLLNKCWTSMQQEADIIFYGPFKGVVWRNLSKIAMTCCAKEITMSLGTSTFGLIVYNGI